MPQNLDFSNPNSSLDSHKPIITVNEAMLHFEQMKTRDPEIANLLEQRVKQAIEDKKSVTEIIGMVFGIAKIFL